VGDLELWKTHPGAEEVWPNLGGGGRVVGWISSSRLQMDSRASWLRLVHERQRGFLQHLAVAAIVGLSHYSLRSLITLYDGDATASGQKPKYYWRHSSQRKVPRAVFKITASCDGSHPLGCIARVSFLNL